MFDGIEQVSLFVTNAGPSLRLYCEYLGFNVISQETLTDTLYRNLWGLPATGEPLGVTLLGKEGASGGWIRLIEVPDLPPRASRRSAHEPGAFALDFYVRGVRDLYDRLIGAGYEFRSPPLEYELPGTGLPVTEVFLEGPGGLLNAFVEYVPDRHRCVLGSRPTYLVSEVAAAVTIVEDVDEGLELVSGALGGTVYLDQVFTGPEVAELLDLPSASRFRMALVRGPHSRNARIELMEAVPGPAEGPRAPPARMMFGWRVPDLAVLDDLRSAEGALIEPVSVRNGVHGNATTATFTAPWGMTLEFWARFGG